MILKQLEDYYLKGKYDAALELLLKNKYKFDARVFHYNFGTIQIKKGQFAAGRYHLERAIKYGPVDSKILKNLAEAEKNLMLVNSTYFSKSVSDQIYDFFLAQGQGAYLSFSLLLGIIFSLVIILKKIRSKMIIVSLVAVVLSPLLFYKFYLSDLSYGVALNSLAIREGPSKIYPLSSEAPAGVKVIVGNSVEKLHKGWLYVRSPADFAGWVQAIDIGLY